MVGRHLEPGKDGGEEALGRAGRQRLSRCAPTTAETDDLEAAATMAGTRRP